MGHVKERGERRENEMFYNLIMHIESTVFSYALGIGKHCKCPLILVKFGASNVGAFLWFFFFFFIFFLNIGKKMSYRESAVSALKYKSIYTSIYSRDR